MNTTVLIPVFNRLQFVLEAIESVLASTVPCKILLCDDASTDGTVHLLKSFAEKQPDQIRLIQNKVNGGESVCRNRLLEEVDTPLACWLDSDDVMTPDRIAKQSAALGRDKADICWSSYETFSKMVDKKPKRSRIFSDPELPRWWKEGWQGMKTNMGNPTGFFRVAPLKKYQFPEDVRWGGQDSLWTYILFMLRHPVTTIPDVVYSMRRHAQQTTVQKKHHIDAKIVEAEVITATRRKVEAQARLYSESFWMLRKKEAPLLRQMAQTLIAILRAGTATKTDRSTIRSMVDLGCGTGTLLEGAKLAGVTDLIGYDVSTLESQKHVFPETHPLIHGANLCQPIRSPRSYDRQRTQPSKAGPERKYDLATSLEVAEHLPESAADTFVANLTNLATQWIVITAAPPGQGGCDHVNEQPKEYWIEKLEARGWVLHHTHSHNVAKSWKSFLTPPKAYYWNNVMVFRPRPQ